MDQLHFRSNKGALKPLSVLVTALALQACSSGSGSGSGSSAVDFGANEFTVSAVTDLNGELNQVTSGDAIGTVVGITASAVDADIEFNAVTYSLTDDANGLFAIDDGTGVVTLAQAADFSAGASQTLEITATSADTSSTAATYTVAVIDPTAPAVSLRFPAANSVTDDDNVTISGSVSVGDGKTITSLTVKVGDAAAVDVTPVAGDFSYDAMLSADAANTIIITLTDSNSAVATQTIAVEQYQDVSSGPQINMTEPRGVAVDAAGTSAYVIDHVLLAVVKVNLSDRTSAIFSDSTTGTGDAFEGFNGGIVVDAANDRLLVANSGTTDAVIAVDLTTGNRTTLSSAGNLTTPYDLALDSAGNRVFVSDSALDGIVAVDLTTGVQTVITSNAVGTGDIELTPKAIAYDGTDLYMIGLGLDLIYKVEVATGNRTVFSSTPINSIRGMSYDATNNRLLVADGGTPDGVYAVSLTDGVTTEVSGSTVGSTLSGPDFSRTYDAVWDVTGARILTVDADASGFFSVAANGDRTEIAPDREPVPSVGTGTALADISGLALDPSGNILYVSDDSLDAIVTVDLVTGNRVVLADSNSAGTKLDSPRGIGYDTVNDRLLVADNGLDAVVAIDLTVGAGSLVSDDDSVFTSSETFASPRGNVAIESATTALVADTSRDSLIRFNLATGERTTVAEAGEAGTAELEGIQSVVMDTENNQAFVTVASGTTAETLDGIIAVSLTDGVLTTIANRSTDTVPVGTGPDMTNPRGLVLDSVAGVLYVLDSDLDALVKVNVATFERTIVSDGITGYGDLFDSIEVGSNALVLDAANKRVYAASDNDQIIMIDLVTGDQVVVSK